MGEGGTTSGWNKMWGNDDKVLSKSRVWQTSAIWLLSGKHPGWRKGTSSLANSASEGVAGGSWSSGWAWVDIKSNTILLQSWEGACVQGGRIAYSHWTWTWQSSCSWAQPLGQLRVGVGRTSKEGKCCQNEEWGQSDFQKEKKTPDILIPGTEINAIWSKYSSIYH